MNEVKIRGTVHFLDEVKEYGQNNFRKREVVINTGNEKWDNPIPVEFIKEGIEKSEHLYSGQEVEIECSVKGREWQGKDGQTKYFLSLQGREITFLSEPAETGDSPSPF